MKKTYLGDSVYAVDDGMHIVLTTENGFGPTNTILLDSQVINALMMLLEHSHNLKIVVTRKDEVADE